MPAVCRREGGGGGKVPSCDRAGARGEREVQQGLGRPQASDGVVDKHCLKRVIVVHVSVGRVAGRGEQRGDRQPISDESEHEDDNERREEQQQP